MEKPLKAVPGVPGRAATVNKAALSGPGSLAPSLAPRPSGGPKDTAPSCLQSNFQPRSGLRPVLTALKCHHFYSGLAFNSLPHSLSPAPLTTDAHPAGKQRGELA